MGYSNTSKGRGIKGSKYWIQTVIEDECLRNKLDSMIGEPLVWISPLAGSKNTYDEYELKDPYVCDQMGVSTDDAQSLFSFWPKRQPQWDGLAFDATGHTLYLVEAKAHLAELDSKCSASKPESKALILNSMQTIHDRYFPKGNFDSWVNNYYQLGNRLTFLRILNEKSFGHINAVKLVLLNFVNDQKYKPTTEHEWLEHYENVWFEMIGRRSAPQDVIVINYDVS